MNEGYVGCFLISMCLIPQSYKTWTTQNVDGLSPYFISTCAVASILMIAYGTRIEAYPVIVANTSVLLNNVFLMCMYRNYSKLSSSTMLRTEQLHAVEI